MTSNADVQDFHRKYSRSQTIYDLQDFLKKKGYYLVVGSDAHRQEIRLEGEQMLDFLLALRTREPTVSINVWHKNIDTLFKNLRPVRTLAADADAG